MWISYRGWGWDPGLTLEDQALGGRVGRCILLVPRGPWKSRENGECLGGPKLRAWIFPPGSPWAGKVKALASILDLRSGWVHSPEPNTCGEGPASPVPSVCLLLPPTWASPGSSQHPPGSSSVPRPWTGTSTGPPLPILLPAHMFHPCNWLFPTPTPPTSSSLHLAHFNHLPGAGNKSPPSSFPKCLDNLEIPQWESHSPPNFLMRRNRTLTPLGHWWLPLDYPSRSCSRACLLPRI